MENKDIYQKIFDIVRQIPVGKVTTYGHIARAIGIGMSARMVGWALNSLAFQQTDVPAHRVVNRRGELTGRRYFPTPNYMKELLVSEGVSFIGDAVDLNKHLWIPEISQK
ncbi:MAG: Methylated-DNA-[protein]-cysteine S-methyltransferase [Candidatus Kapaibacterium sp.]|jgi:methylated-DNA-protein-cysteine methyltransferase-like protein|nr:MAG: Methylated-DNA-[protein]-cysteine S-methyltransferase [Candidatus Kapabacteria bacterium]ROL58399.1 MAG: MGMT family protein [Bacteroidetes/Chlorobi group bacterium Naka2016]